MINKQFIFNKALPKVLVALLGLVVLSLLGIGAYFLVSKLTNVPYKVRVTNITGSSATVSWYTNRPDNGLVVYGQEKGFWYGFVSFLGKNIGYDDRDWALAEKDLISDIAKAAKSQQSIENTDVEVHKLGNYYVHHVTIRDLDPNTKYYFKVGNGLWSWDLEEERQLTTENQLPTVSTAFEFSTYDHPKDIPTPKPAYGRVYGMVKDSQGYLTENDSTDSIVFVLENKSDASGHSQILSSVTNERGGWTVDKSNFRDQNGILAKGYIEGKDLLVTYVQYQNNEENSMQAFLLGKNDAPTPGLRGNSLETLENPKVSMNLFDGLFVSEVLALEVVGEDENGYPITYNDKTGNYTNQGTHEVVNENSDDYNDVITEWSTPSSDEEEEDEEDVVYTDPPREDVLMSGKDLKGTNLPGYCYSGYTYDEAAGGCVPTRTQPTTAGNSSCEEVGSLGCEVPNCYCEIKNAAGVPIGRYPMSKDCRPAACANSNRRTDEVVNTETGKLEVKNNICPVSVKCEDGSCPAEHGGKCPHVVPLEPGLEDGDYTGDLTPEVNEVVDTANPVSGGSCEDNNGKKIGNLECVCIGFVRSGVDMGAGYGCVWREIQPAALTSPAGWETCGGRFIPETERCAMTPFDESLWENCGNNKYALKSHGGCLSYSSYLSNLENIENEDIVCCQYNSSPKWEKANTQGNCPGNSYPEEKSKCVDIPYISVGVSVDNYSSAETNWWQDLGGVRYDCCNISGLHYEIRSNEASCGDYEKVSFSHCIDPNVNLSVQTINCYDPDTSTFNTVRNETGTCPEGDVNYDAGKESVAFVTTNNKICCFNQSTGKLTLTDNTGTKDNSGTPSCPSGLGTSTVVGSCASDSIGSSRIDTVVLGASDVAEEENTDNNSVIYFPESGIYDVSVDNKNFEIFIDKNTEYFFFEERNGMDGYQAPASIKDVKENEDKLIDVRGTNVKLSKVTSAFDVSLRAGVNIISFPYMPIAIGGTPLKASEFLSLANKDSLGIRSITYFDSGKWVGGLIADSTDGSVNSGLDFELTFGRGYLIIAEKDFTFEVPGYEINTSIPLALSSGWNLVGIHGYTETYTASSLIDSIGTIEGLGADNVTYWPTSKGRYEGLQKSEGTEYGFDFPIREDLGYFVRINKFEPKETSTKSIIWNPGGDLNGKPGSN